MSAIGLSRRGAALLVTLLFLLLFMLAVVGTGTAHQPHPKGKPCQHGRHVGNPHCATASPTPTATVSPSPTQTP